MRKAVIQQCRISQNTGCRWGGVRRRVGPLTALHDKEDSTLVPLPVVLFFVALVAFRSMRLRPLTFRQ